MFIDRWNSYTDHHIEKDRFEMRNEPAVRFNAAAQKIGMSTVPIPDGYVLDYCLEKLKTL